MRSRLYLFAFLLILPVRVPAADESPADVDTVETPVSRPVHIRRYGIRVRADRTELASGVARLTESVFGRIEERCELPLASEGKHSLEILVAQRKGLSGRNLFAQEGDGSARGQQRLLIKDAALTEHESFVELCAWLVLNRAIRVRQDAKAPRRTVHSPDWLAVGIAQDAEAPLRMRNGAVMRVLVREGNVPPLEEIVKWTHMPRGRWAEKAVCGRLVRWMFSESQHEKRLDQLLTRAGEDGGITLEAIAEFMDMSSDEAASAAWLNWALAENHRIRQPGMMSLDDLKAFRGVLVVNPQGMDLGTDEAFSPEAMKLADLVTYRDSAWLARVVALKKQELQFFAVGRGQQLIDVAASYSDALDRLILKKSEKDILSGLRKATRALDDLEAKTQLRNAHFDDIERRYDSTSRDLMMQRFAPKGSLERSPHQRYIDDFERRF